MSHETPRGVNGQASDQASWWARPALAPWEDKSTARHTEVARSAQSHSQAPPPILASTTTQNQQPNTHRSARTGSGGAEFGEVLDAILHTPVCSRPYPGGVPLLLAAAQFNPANLAGNGLGQCREL